MNIYIHLEVSSRELDSKLLLATIAANRGHQVLISSSPEIISGLDKGFLLPGIFHTKSLTPSNVKIKRHEKIINKKSLVTSIDEEAAINDFDYRQFSKDRYSDKSIDQSSAVFCWGNSDTNTLKTEYPTHSLKIFKTGSPRADLWKPIFSGYWKSPKQKPSKPFLLVASNLFVTSLKPFYRGIQFGIDAGYFDRNPEAFKKSFFSWSNDYKKLYEYIEAIKFLAQNNKGYDIVLRPHPVEDVRTWKTFLHKIPNVHVVRNDSITAWVNSAFAIMHNACTTGIEASISGKALLTYMPPNIEYDSDILSNKLGFIVKSKEELSSKVNEIFEANFSIKQKQDKIKINELITEKVFLDNNELAAEKILKIWESLNSKNLSQSNHWLKFYCFLKITNIKNIIRNIANKLFPNVFKSIEKNHKFPPLDQKDIQERVNRLQNILGIEKKLKCKLFSERTILIRN